MVILRNVGEIGFGVIFLIGAIFNLSYTLRHAEEFYGGFADNAWSGPARTLVRDAVIPNAPIFTSLLIAFQVAVAVMILTRGDLAKSGLIAGAVFSLAAAGVSSPGGAIGNVAMGAALALLAYTR